MGKSIVWPLLVLAIVCGLWCEAWAGAGAGDYDINFKAREVQEALRRAAVDKQLRNNFVDCILRCSSGEPTKRPSELVRGCRDKCVEDYLWHLRREAGEER